MEAISRVVEDTFVLTRKMRVAFDAVMREKGLTLARARILMRLRRAGAGETQKALAEELDIEGATLVRLLDGLQEAGCVTRRAVEGDRRANAVVLTPEGEARARDVEADFVRFRGNVLKEISAEDLAAAERVILRMQSNLEQL